MDERLQDLVDRGFITQEQLDEIEGWFGEHRPWNGELPEDFDPKEFRERYREHAPWNGELPEYFDPEEFRERYSEHAPWNGELPEDFDLEEFKGPRFGPHEFRFFGGDQEDLESLFGVTPDELMDALAEGIPPMDIIEDPEAFLDSLLGPIEEQLNRAVEEGALTQAEADELIEAARSRAEAFINGEPFEGERFMGPRGPHDFGGFWHFGEFGPHGRSNADSETARSLA
jgi:hypothetical protein